MPRKAGKRAKSNGANGKRRVNGTGTLEKRGGDKWLARWCVVNPQGQRVRISKTFEADGIDAARAKLRELTEENAVLTQERALDNVRKRLGGITEQLAEIADKAPALTLADAFDVFATETREGQRPRESTRGMYRYQYGKFLAWLAEHAPDCIEVRHVGKRAAWDFSQHILKTTSPSTHNRYLDLLRSMWDALDKRDAIFSAGRAAGAPPKDGEKPTARLACNPWKVIDRADVEVDDTRRELTEDELRRVVAAFDDGDELRLLFCIGIYSGLRLGDCACLQWDGDESRVELDRGLITVTPSKTKRTTRRVQIPIVYIDKQTGTPRPSELWTMLSAIPADERTGYVLPQTAKMYQHDRAAVTDRIQRHFRRCGIETSITSPDGARAKVATGFHSLRHSFVTLAARSGMSLEIVKEIVGHRNTRMTEHYTHVRADWLQREMSAFPTLGITGKDDGDTPAPLALPAPDANGDARLEAFKASWYALTDEERQQARKWLDDML